MQSKYLTQITCKDGTIFKIVVSKDSAEPFLVMRKYPNSKFFMQIEKSYYSLGSASKRMGKDAIKHGGIISMDYTNTAEIVKSLPDFYRIEADGTVKRLV